MKSKIKNEKEVSLTNSESFSELASILYSALEKINNSTVIPKVNFVENMSFENNTNYSGPVIYNNIPYGAGMLIINDSNIKFIGEFENGKIKHNFEMRIIQKEFYLFDKEEMQLILVLF